MIIFSSGTLKKKKKKKMAMDRTMYGKVEPSAIYQPYKITITKGSPPGCESIILFMFLTLLILRDFNALYYNFKMER